MNTNKSFRIRQALLGLVDVFEEELDRNPTTADMRKWFKSQRKERQNEIRREIYRMKEAARNKT